MHVGAGGGRVVNELSDMPASYGGIHHDRCRVGDNDCGDLDIRPEERGGGLLGAEGGGDFVGARDAHAPLWRVEYDSPTHNIAHGSICVEESDFARDADVDIDIQLMNHHELLAMGSVVKWGVGEIEVEQAQSLRIAFEQHPGPDIKSNR